MYNQKRWLFYLGDVMRTPLGCLLPVYCAITIPLCFVIHFVRMIPNQDEFGTVMNLIMVTLGTSLLSMILLMVFDVSRKTITRNAKHWFRGIAIVVFAIAIFLGMRIFYYLVLNRGSYLDNFVYGSSEWASPRGVELVNLWLFAVCLAVTFLSAFEG